MLRAVLIVCLSLLTIEVIAQASRVTDVPLYRADRRIGYIPVPNQAGAFVWTNGWAFNDLSMGTPRRFVAGLPRRVLLIGDSIVLGGNPYSRARPAGTAAGGGERVPGVADRRW
ncbi:MAG: hypothetical protein JWN21_142 [Sphingomonas bacterium]|uniref:hypothetical protein n=1 Tax=Sphingomonas bacterium TaxID=1895847 RepID=UPI0026326AC6|nr:hypothetical protein [Sphingomonas bacterium]MDB5694599.1 hypothetical protein [Sphingomonas bacterium]